MMVMVYFLLQIADSWFVMLMLSTLDDKEYTLLTLKHSWSSWINELNLSNQALGDFRDFFNLHVRPLFPQGINHEGRIPFL